MTQTSNIPFRTRSEVVAAEPDNSGAWTGETTVVMPRVDEDDHGPTLPDVPQTLITSNFLRPEDELRDFLRQETDISAEPATNVHVFQAERENVAAEAAQAMAANPIPDIDSANEMELRLSNEFVPIKEDNWDTVLYIGPPLQQHGESAEKYEYIKSHFSRPYLMRSQTLRNSGSSEFIRRLGPMSARVERKLKKLGLQNALPNDGIPKYWIDLRPMQNDDEALVTVAELTCTPGVLIWHRSGASCQVDHTLIRGKDNLNTPKGIVDKVKLPPDFFSKDVGALKFDSKMVSNVKTTPDTFDDLEADYSPLRHHTAIERLLHAIAGNSPKLNSAPKMWTFFAVAKIFDCATHPRVYSEIFTWIFAGFNSNFIAANPEVCYRIAMGTQSKMLLRVVFCILVGEKALHQARIQGPSQPSLSPTTTRVRALSHLDDDEINRIDHAARSLSLRIQKKFCDMLASPITWMTKSTEIFKLFAIIGVNPHAQETIDSAINLLFQHVRAEVLFALSQVLKISTRRDAPVIEDGEPIKERQFEPDVLLRYNPLTMPQRLLSQVSWIFIKAQSILHDDCPFQITGITQWDGLNDINPGLRIPSRARIDFEAKMAAINNSISDGFIHYHNVHSHKNYVADYEIRWDALFSAACRNVDSIDKNLPPSGREALLATAHRREVLYQEGVRQYESAHSSGSTTINIPAWPDSKQGPPYAADQHYTSAKIDFFAIWSQLSTALSSEIETQILRPGYLDNASGIEADINVDSIDTLLCLGEEEFKFLPLWADGCDDGSGGVFTETVPGAMDEDFQGGKRGLGPDDEGLDGLDDVEMGESFSVIDSREAESTVAGASKVATAGYGTDSVMSMDE